MRRDLRFIVLIPEDLEVQPFKDLITEAAFSPELRAMFSCFHAVCFNSFYIYKQTMHF